MALLDLPCERARLEGMTVGQLARVYEEIVGEPTRSCQRTTTGGVHPSTLAIC
jgi:hypothetical protein